MKFKVGDTVRLIDADTLICVTEGRCYEITGVWPFGRLRIKDDNGEEAFYSDYRFERINEMANLEKGDIVVALEDDRDITKGKWYLVMGTYKQHGEMWANIYDDVRDKRSFTLSQKRFERINMDEKKEVEARIEQCKVDQGKLGEEQERLEGKLKKLTVVYSVGDRFMYEGRKYILACARPGKAFIMSLRGGCRWVCEKNVANCGRITPEELKRITDDDAFARYWDSRKGEKV